MKTFSEVKQGDTVYFLIDTCNILQEYGNKSVGFANRNYGLVLAKRTVVSDRWEWHNPRTETGLLFRIYVDRPIIKDDRCLFGPHINEYGNKSDNCISVTKAMGRETCISNNFGDFFVSYTGYIFTTREELEAKVRNITNVVEDNLKKINEGLNTLL